MITRNGRLLALLSTIFSACGATSESDTASAEGPLSIVDAPGPLDGCKSGAANFNGTLTSDGPDITALSNGGNYGTKLCDRFRVDVELECHGGPPRAVKIDGFGTQRPSASDYSNCSDYREDITVYAGTVPNSLQRIGGGARHGEIVRIDGPPGAFLYGCKVNDDDNFDPIPIPALCSGFINTYYRVTVRATRVSTGAKLPVQVLFDRAGN
ncbi:MAG TPA: hypothetical protein VFQ61_36125 [Polyangiaceae bacterium]|nr:hypothetical protein [Polyangiaceae bacterium]